MISAVIFYLRQAKSEIVNTVTTHLLYREGAGGHHLLVVDDDHGPHKRPHQQVQALEHHNGPAHHQHTSAGITFLGVLVMALGAQGAIITSTSTAVNFFTSQLVISPLLTWPSRR
jgi:hypothetical protein